MRILSIRHTENIKLKSYPKKIYTLFKKAYWKSEGLYFENSDSIIPAPQYDGKMCKLSFYIDGKVVKTKELLVKKKAQNEN